MKKNFNQSLYQIISSINNNEIPLKKDDVKKVINDILWLIKYNIPEELERVGKTKYYDSYYRRGWSDVIDVINKRFFE